MSEKLYSETQVRTMLRYYNRPEEEIQEILGRFTPVDPVGRIAEGIAATMASDEIISAIGDHRPGLTIHHEGSLRGRDIAYGLPDVLAFELVEKTNTALGRA